MGKFRRWLLHKHGSVAEDVASEQLYLICKTYNLDALRGHMHFGSGSRGNYQLTDMAAPRQASVGKATRKP